VAVRRSKQALALGLCALAVPAVAGCGEPKAVQDRCELVWITSFSVEYCGPEPSATELAGEGTCADTIFCHGATPCVAWDVVAPSGPGLCVLVLTADGQEYRAEVELVEVRECPSRYGPADGGPVRLGPDCADAGPG